MSWKILKVLERFSIILKDPGKFLRTLEELERLEDFGESWKSLENTEDFWKILEEFGGFWRNLEDL